MSEHQCNDCEYCKFDDDGKMVYRHQACMPLNSKVYCIDWCIHQIVAALNAGGVWTKVSCCGHNRIIGHIGLEDGRVLYIAKDPDMHILKKAIELAGYHHDV